MRDRKIGSFWVVEDKNGEKYLSGEVFFKEEKQKVMLFKNKNKKQEKHPDWELYLKDKNFKL